MRLRPLLVIAAALIAMGAVIAWYSAHSPHRLPFAFPTPGHPCDGCHTVAHPQGDFTAATWDRLRSRSLTSPAMAAAGSCPVAAPAHGRAAHPVHADGFPIVAGVPWPIYLVADPDFGGPVLLRGKQLDGTGTLFFTDLGASTGRGRSIAPGLTGWEEYDARVPIQRAELGWSAAVQIFTAVPGCWAIQVDGAGFSETVAFVSSAVRTGG